MDRVVSNPEPSGGHCCPTTAGEVCVCVLSGVGETDQRQSGLRGDGHW